MTEGPLGGPRPGVNVTPIVQIRTTVDPDEPPTNINLESFKDTFQNIATEERRTEGDAPFPRQAVKSVDVNRTSMMAGIKREWIEITMDVNRIDRGLIDILQETVSKEVRDANPQWTIKF